MILMSSALISFADAQTAQDASLLEAERQQIMLHYKKAALELAEIGKRLKTLKKRLRSAKDFKAFLGSLPFSPRSAYHFMQLHEHVLRYGSATVATENICIAAWYIAPPENEAIVAAIIEKSKTEKVTSEDVRKLLSTTKISDDRLSLSLQTAATENPSFVIGMVAKGALDTVDGLTIPLEDMTAQDLSLAWENDKWQRKMLHIEENSTTIARSLEMPQIATLEALYDYSSVNSRKRARKFRLVWEEIK